MTSLDLSLPFANNLKPTWLASEEVLFDNGREKHSANLLFIQDEEEEDKDEDKDMSLFPHHNSYTNLEEASEKYCGLLLIPLKSNS